MDMLHYYSREPASRERRFVIRDRVRGFRIELVSASGVFSARRIDRGTRLLVESMIVEDGWTILDLGCGYGIVGIVAAKLAPRGVVYMVDINRRAVELAKLNARINGVRNVEVLWGDLYEPVAGIVFDAVVSNPPQAAGRGVLRRIVRGARACLRPGGLLQLVARHAKGGARLMEEMEETFGNVEVVAKRGGFRVYVSKNS